MTRPDDEQRVVRLRQRWWKWELLRLPLMTLLVFITGVNAWMLPHGESGHSVAWPWLLAGMGLTAVLATTESVALLRGSAILTPQDYRGYRPFRRRLRLAWTDVAGITAEPGRFGTRVVACLRDGRRVVLPFPVGPKSALWQPSEQGVWFWAHYHRIGGQWRQHCAQPAPAPSRPPAATP